MKYSLTILDMHMDELKKLVLSDDLSEAPAILLCGKSKIKNDIWDGGPEVRFLSKEVVPIPKEHVTNATSISVSWDTTIFRKLLKKAKDEDLAICLVHSHPAGALQFSPTDDEQELELFQTIINRNRSEDPNLSLIITYDLEVTARVCTARLKYQPIGMVRVMGNSFDLHYPTKYSSFDKEEFHRQQLAFGRALNNDLSKMKIAVIGCGATGSATAHLLARLGVGHLLLIDKDIVERSNLSRLYGATSSDADFGRLKAEVLANFITSIGIGCRVRYLTEWVATENARNALKSCDVIFCCTDDNSGRIFLNRFAHFYNAPVFDMGIVIELSNTNDIIALQGRLTILAPGNVCLLCRGTVDKQLAREEALKRNDPDGFERQKEEAYVIGGGNPSPAVITFTTEVATMAVNEFINRLTGFKKIPPEKHIMRFFDQGLDRRPGAKSTEGCLICGDKIYWGRGDVEPFMDQAN